jgi:hypothetical protein
MQVPAIGSRRLALKGTLERFDLRRREFAERLPQGLQVPLRLGLIRSRSGGRQKAVEDALTFGNSFLLYSVPRPALEAERPRACLGNRPGDF